MAVGLGWPQPSAEGEGACPPSALLSRTLSITLAACGTANEAWGPTYGWVVGVGKPCPKGAGVCILHACV